MSERRWINAVGALAVLFAGVTSANVHVHLCFDGQEPSAAVHIDHDLGQQHHDDDSTAHDDLDLDLGGEGIAKSFKSDLPDVVPEPVRVLALVGDAVAALWGDARGADSTDPPYVRPPSRAPPSNLR